MTRSGRWSTSLRRAGRRPYAIPRGGGVALACLGYVDCVRELGEQLAALELQPDCLVVAVGTSCTQAGLLLGARLHDASYRIVGVTVSRPAAECRERIAGFAREAACLAGHPLELGPEEITVRDGFIGPGYGVPTPGGIEAIRLVARTEGLFLDPTYTAKAMAGLINEIRSGGIRRDEIVVFLHTGGEPGLFAHPEVRPSGVSEVTETSPGLERYRQQILAWRQWREERLREPDGWLTLAGLFWLEEGENPFGTGGGESGAAAGRQRANANRSLRAHRTRRPRGGGTGGARPARRSGGRRHGPVLGLRG